MSFPRLFSVIPAKAGIQAVPVIPALIFCHSRESGNPGRSCHSCVYFFVIPAKAGIQAIVIAALDPVVQRGKLQQSRENMKNYYVYILTNKRNGTLYIGITSNLRKRIYEHKNNLVKGFTKEYNVHDLVYYEQTSDIMSAIKREKNLKKWKREWKLDLIEKSNPTWEDLYNEL